MSEDLRFPWPRKEPFSLAILSQIAFIKQVHQYASNKETDYMDSWLEALTKPNKLYEERLNIRNEVDTEAVVLKFKSQESAMIKQRRLEYEKAEAESVKKNNKKKRRSARRKANEPYNNKNKKKAKAEEFIISSLKPKLVHGIPEGVRDQDFIEYRKCKYIEDIRQVRKYLERNLNPGATNDLMRTMYNIAQYNNKHEHGLLTLQSMLMTRTVTEFKIAPAKFYRNFTTVNHFQMKDQLANIETKIGTTILHFTLMQGERLTRINIEKCCCDSMLKVISETASNLKYLNISGSLVSDQGIFYLCGVEKNTGRSRPKLTRACKAKVPSSDRLVTNELPKWEQRKLGCRKLQYFEAENLQKLDWPGQAVMKYYDHATVPVDCAFVALLLYLKDLIVFKTDVGGRVIAAWQKVLLKGQKGDVKARLNLEYVSEAHLTPALLDLINLVCPKLKHLSVDWYEFFTQQPHSREDWIPRLDGCHGLKELYVADVDCKTANFSQVLPAIGASLTVLQLRELWTFKYSNFFALKECCPNLVKLSVAMTSRNVVASINHINVDKDHNLQLGDNERSSFAKLREFHLSGPFGNDVVRYLLRGADHLKVLTLGIEWLDPAFCDNQPLNRKDLLGTEYLTEILTVNKMEELEEIHLLAQYRRGRNRLVRSCADMILEKFPNIRHIGNFQYWNMTPTDVLLVVNSVHSSNRDVTFDEDLTTGSYERAVFEYKYIPMRNHLKCNQIMFKKDSSNFLSDFFDVLAGPPELMDDDEEDDDFLDGDDGFDGDNLLVMDEELSDDDEEDDDGMDNGDDFFGGADQQLLLADDMDPVCAIM